MTVDVTLSKRFAHLTSEYPFEELQGVFRYRSPGYRFSPHYKIGRWDGFVNLMRNGKIPVGCFLALREEAEAQAHIRFRVLDQREPLDFRPLSKRIAIKIRDYQTHCVDEMIAASQSGGLVLCATGTGKTFLAGAFLSRLKGDGCFVVDELTLLDQAREELAGVLKEQVGIVGRSEFSPERITVATIQTLHRHRKKAQFKRWFKDLQVLIVDEFHVALNRRNIAIVQTIGPTAVYGLTATLEMQKRDVLLRATALAGPVIARYSLEQGMQENVLAQGVACRILFPGPTSTDNYQSDYKTLIVESEARNGCIVELACEGVKRGHRVVVLVERLDHLERLSHRLKQQGVAHEVVCGARSAEERGTAKRRMESGELPLILANNVFAKGINIRSISVIIDATAGRSKNSVQQRYGRGSRTSKGKQGLVFLDVSDKGNRFETNARSRAKALKSLGVPVISLRWPMDVGQVFDKVGLELRKAVGRHGLQC